MSPEQAEGMLDRLGPRSDVYSLGATLYALLTGRPAFEGGDLGSVLARVRGGEFPPPRQVHAAVRPALEAVCLKAMATRPEDRYGSPRELADELEHWLADEPVGAWREPWRTRAGRWARRHKPVVAAAAALLLAAVLGLSTGVVLLRAEQRRTESARQEAIRNYRAAAAAGQTAVAARAEAEANLARALDAVDTMLVRVSQKHLVNQPHFEPVRRQLLEDALGFYQGFLAREPDAPQVLLQAARAYCSAANIHRQLGQRDLARQELQRAAELLGRIAAGPEVDLELAAVHHGRAVVDADERRVPEAIEELNRGLAGLGRLGDRSPDERASRAALTQMAESQSQLGSLLTLANRLAEAREALHQARSALERLLQTEPRDETIRHRLSAVSINEGLLGFFQDDPSATVGHLTRAIGLLDELRKSAPDAVHYRRDLATSSNLLADALGKLGKFAGAVEAGHRAIALFGQLAAEYPTVAEHRYRLAAAHHNLGSVLAAAGHLESARGEYRSAIEAAEVLTRRDPGNPVYLRDLANSHM
jgi:tetratricopeptide (TPR) repeat protein